MEASGNSDSSKALHKRRFYEGKTLVINSAKRGTENLDTFDTAYSLQ